LLGKRKFEDKTSGCYNGALYLNDTNYNMKNYLNSGNPKSLIRSLKISKGTTLCWGIEQRAFAKVRRKI